MTKLKPQYESQSISGWGRIKKVNADVVKPNKISEIQEIIRSAPSKSVLARGMGLSYGDAAQLNGGTLIELPFFKNISLDLDKGIVTAGAGVTLEEILKEIVPKGFFLPVTPGSRNVTLGGAIASDVHGKNHHVDGSFGNHVDHVCLDFFIL